MPGICVDSNQYWCCGICCSSNYGDPFTQPDGVFACWPFASAKNEAGFAPRRADLAKIQFERDRVFTTRLRLMELKTLEIGARTAARERHARLRDGVNRPQHRAHAKYQAATRRGFVHHQNEYSALDDGRGEPRALFEAERFQPTAGGSAQERHRTPSRFG
jgi:hypothetical protein